MDFNTALATKFVIKGFTSVSELWNFSTPELLNSEIKKVVSEAIALKADDKIAFNMGLNRAQELLQKFEFSQQEERKKIEKLQKRRLEQESLLEKGFFLLSSRESSTSVI